MLDWSTIIIAAIIFLQPALFATSIYLHRCLSHRALRLHKSVDVVMRTVLWLAVGIVPRQWVAVHRKHHTFTDKKGDPHSPLRLGFWKVQLGNYYYYRKEINNKKTIQTFAKDIPVDVFDKVLFNHGNLGTILGITILAASIGLWNGLTAWGIHAAFYVFFSSSINGICHWWGYKNFHNTSATNIRLLSFLVAGEGLHNNHHGRPTCPKFSMKWHEFDPSWLVIKPLTWLGLAKAMPTVKL